uniref:Uncharacterized protein n=1 Tax=Zea mays TaxID=4577 RepID=A0A804PTG5_MAIZE
MAPAIYAQDSSQRQSSLLALDLDGHMADVVLRLDVPDHLVKDLISVRIPGDGHMARQQHLAHRDGPDVQLVDGHHALHPAEPALQPGGVDLAGRALHQHFEDAAQHPDRGEQHHHREDERADEVDDLPLRLVPDDRPAHHDPDALDGVPEHVEVCAVHVDVPPRLLTSSASRLGTLMLDQRLLNIVIVMMVVVVGCDSDSASMAVLVVMDTALFLLLVVVVGMAIVRIPMAVAMVMRMSMSMAVAVPVVMAQQHGHENVDGQPERRHGEHERPPHVAALADEPHDGLVHQYAGEQPDELDGDEGAEDLHPEEPVRLPRRRLPPGGPEREQRDGERRHVRQEVRRVGQDGQAVRLDAPHHLHRHEYDAEDHRDYQLPHRRRPLPGVLRGVAGVGEVAGCALAELAPCRSRS